jgi:hypothetical protein
VLKGRKITVKLPQELITEDGDAWLHWSLDPLHRPVDMQSLHWAGHDIATSLLLAPEPGPCRVLVKPNVSLPGPSHPPGAALTHSAALVRRA